MLVTNGWRLTSWQANASAPSSIGALLASLVERPHGGTRLSTIATLGQLGRAGFVPEFWSKLTCPFGLGHTLMVRFGGPVRTKLGSVVTAGQR